MTRTARKMEDIPFFVDAQIEGWREAYKDIDCERMAIYVKP